jgi:hypothetical protein
MTSRTWSSMSKTMKSKISFASFLGQWALADSSATPCSPLWNPEPKNSSIKPSPKGAECSSTATVRTHPSDRHFASKLIPHRRNQSISGLCRHVCYAVLPFVLGGCPAHGTKSAILHIPEWRLSNPDQGITFIDTGPPLALTKMCL